MTRRAFTVVEMIVVIGIVALILAIGVPAFNTMTVQQRLSKTRQLLNGTLLRTQVIAESSGMPTAVRLCPANWHLSEDAATEPLAGRQIITTYQEVSTWSANPNELEQVLFDERFERIADGPTHLLPPDTWIAPSEALDVDHEVSGSDWDDDYVGNYVLDGEIASMAQDDNKGFWLNADSRDDSSERLLDADDFLIIFDPETGVRNDSLRRQPARLKAFDPRPEGYARTAQLETDGERRGNTGTLDDPFQRFNFSGAVIYRREPFAALGADADSNAEYRARRDALRRFGQTYYVHRTAGKLVAGAGQGEED